MITPFRTNKNIHAGRMNLLYSGAAQSNKNKSQREALVRWGKWAKPINIKITQFASTFVYKK